MARFKGDYPYPYNYEVKKQELLDPRGGVDTKEELINKETFPYDGDVIFMKEGMLVTVKEEQSVYMLISLENILADDYSGWKRVDAGAAAASVEIEDSLTSDATDKALSAKQGKALKEEIDNVKEKVTSIYTPKGSKDKYTDLPTDAAVGDVWNVVEAYNGYPAGTNWAWNGEEWDALGGSIDLGNYYTKTEVNDAIAVETTRAQKKEAALEADIQNYSGSLAQALGDINNLQSVVNQNTTNISNINLILNGNKNPENEDEDTVGLVERLAAVEDLIGNPTEEDKNSTMLTRLATLEELITGSEGGEGTGSTLLSKVNVNTAAIALLNGSSAQEGSVDYKIDQAFKWNEVE